MPFPKTRESLETNGYKLVHVKLCKACGFAIEMWKTPNDRMMPLDFKIDAHGEEYCEPHFAICKDPAQYSERLRAKAAAASTSMSFEES
jgi:hypothetical protein